MNSQKPIPAIRTEVSGRVTLVEVVKDKSGRLDEVKFKIDSNDEILHYYGYDPGANAVAASLSVGDEVKIIYAERLSNHDFWGITIGDVEVMNPQLSFEERKRKGKSLLFAVLSFTLVTLYTFVHFIKLRLQTA